MNPAKSPAQALWFMLLLAFVAIPSRAAATVVAYPDARTAFILDAGAGSIGGLPLGVGPVNSLSVGGVSLVTDSGPFFFGNFSTRVPGNEMIISDQEDFHVTLPTGTFSFGFDLYEPMFSGPSGCNTTNCVDDSFTIQVFAGATLLGTFTYNPPNDDGTATPVPLGFFGVHSDVAFNRVVIQDVTGNIDNEMFANFLRGSLPTPARHASWGHLKTIYR